MNVSIPLTTHVFLTNYARNGRISNSSNDTDMFFNCKIRPYGIYNHALDAQGVVALMTDSQTTARVGGNPYAIKR